MKTFKITLRTNHKTNKNNNDTNSRKVIVANGYECTENITEKIKKLSEEIKADSVRYKYHRRQRQRIRGIGKETKITPHSIIMTDKAYNNATKLYLKKKTVSTRLKNKHSINRRGVVMGNNKMKNKKESYIMGMYYAIQEAMQINNLSDEDIDKILKGEK